MPAFGVGREPHMHRVRYNGEACAGAVKTDAMGAISPCPYQQLDSLGATMPERRAWQAWGVGTSHGSYCIIGDD
jgi:hypothetical protein